MLKQSKMRVATLSLVSLSPFQYNAYVEVDEDDKKLSHGDIEEKNWKNRAHFNKAGNAIIPKRFFQNAIYNASRYHLDKQGSKGKGVKNYSERIRSGMCVVNDIVLPETTESIDRKEEFVKANPNDKKSGRVKRFFPIIHQWSGNLEIQIVDDIVSEDKVPTDLLEKYFISSGMLIGIGKDRPQSNGQYGRYTVADIKWKEVDPSDLIEEAVEKAA